MKSFFQQARRVPSPGIPVLLMAVILAGCASTGGADSQGNARLSSEVRAFLAADWRSQNYQGERNRILRMGSEVDSILVAVAGSRRARHESRAEALQLLAERQSPEALPALRSALQDQSNERLRSAAVLALDRLAPISEQALELIRLAAEDRSRTVRLTALQSLDISEVATIRRVLEREDDPEVRQVALQLVALAESRGAPLMPDRRGVLRTASSETEPQIVFRAVRREADIPVAYGDLRIELADSDIPLGSMVEVVANVVPAFFSPDRAAVVAEVDGEIAVVDVGSRSIRRIGEGSAPRPIPFSNQFVFLRQRPDGQHSTAEGMAILYDVFVGSFNAPGVQQIGSLRAVSRSDVNGGESPVDWMVVAEAGDGFVLTGSHIEPFPLPTTVWGTARMR